MPKIMSPLPLHAQDIFVEWPIEGGGIGVTAYTDEAGLPYIGFYPLNWEGKSVGKSFDFQRSRLMSPVVAGFIGRKPIVVSIDAEITAHGLSAWFCVPVYMAPKNYPHHLSAPWGSEAPRYRMIFNPANIEQR